MTILHLLNTSRLLSPFVFLLLFMFSACGDKNNVVTPQVKPLVEAVYASGYVVAEGEYEVYAQAEGYLIDKMVDDGDTVQKNEPMFVIDADQQSARYRIAKEAYDMALRNYRDDSPVLRELKAAVDASYTKMQFDSLNFVRYTNLLERNATSRADYDRMKLAYENSRNEYELQSNRYKRTRDQLYLELKNAENQLQIAQEESNRYTVRSQMAGMVFRTMKEEGEMIRRGEIVAVVGNKEGFYLQLTVDELDVQRVKVGQDVLVKIDAYPQKVFHATVSKIHPMIDKRQQSIQVDAVLQESLPGWYTGLALEANIVVRRKEDALVVPKIVLLKGDSVVVETEDGEKKIKIKKGIETLDEVEVVEGVDTSHRLVITG